LHFANLVGTTIRNNTTNIDSFSHVFRSTKGNGSIDMDLSNSNGSFGSIVELSRFRNLDEDFLVNSVVKRMPFEVLTAKIFIDQNLSLVLYSLQIDNKWNVEKHVSLEDKGAGRDT